MKTLTIVTTALLLLLQSCSDSERQRTQDQSEVSASTDQREEYLPEPDLPTIPAPDRIDSPESECSLTLSYSIGEIDPEFGINRQQVETYLHSVIGLWEEALNELKVRSDDPDGITVRFLYDERQETADGEQRFQQRLRRMESQINELEEDYERKMNLFEQRSMEHEQLSEQIVDQVDRLNDWVDRQNETGGFTAGDVERLEGEQLEVERMQRRELHQRRELEQLADQTNELIDRINSKIDENNLLVDQYNREFAGEDRFASGRYEWSGDSQTITVYHFRNEAELKLVLAHELGHALGLSHVSNPRSIMYESMGEQLTRERLALSRQDREAARHLCQ